MKTVVISDKTLCMAKESKALTFRERASIAKRLEEIGVDAIMLPQMDRVKEETVMNRTICTAAKNATIKIAAGITEESIAQAWASISCAKNPCLQIALPVSTVQMEYQYHKKTAAMLKMISSLVACAATFCYEVEFVAQDASRAEEGFIAEVCKTAKEAGATAITLCDDAGVWTPNDMQYVIAQVADSNLKVYICPSDALHMAAAVAMAAIQAGADGIVTATAKDALTVEMLCDVLTAKGEELAVTCRLNATEIHRDMEDMKADGLVSTKEKTEEDHRVRLTQDSTLADVISAAETLGYDLSEQDAGLVSQEVRRMADHKASIGARDLEAIIATTAMQVPSTYHLESYVCTSGNIVPAMAQITLTHGGESASGVSQGDGPIDAAFMAIEQIIGHHYELDDFQIQAVTEGRGAIGSALVKLRSGGKLYSGSGVSTDIIGASIRAYLNALNKIVYEEA